MTRARWWALAAVVVIVVLAARYLVWIDLPTRCVLTIRPSLVGYECYGEDDRIMRALVQFE